MLAKDIMTTNVITIAPETSIRDAVKILVENEISGMVVVNAEKDVVGIISEKDLMVAFDWLGVTLANIHDYYNKKIIGVQLDTPVEEVSRILVSENIRRVPVLEGKKLRGLISRRDILKYILKRGT